MSKQLLIILIFLITASFASAQSFKDNPDYRNSIKLKIQSEKAFEVGNYEESTRLANESVIYAERSDKWIAMMLNKYKANSVLTAVRKRLQTISHYKDNISVPEALTEGKTLYEESDKLYKDEKYLESYPIALEAFNVLKVIEFVKQKTALPAAYQIMDFPGDEDCLWKIAEYDFIFGDPLQWKVIYNANKNILPQSENPNLIIPGLVLKIPSLNGEERYGTWINGSIQ